jgi:hypothetical protein
MGGEGEDNVFSESVCQVHLFRALEFDLAGEGGDSDGEIKVFQAAHALEAVGAADAASGKDTSVAKADIQCIGKRRNRNYIRIVNIQNGCWIFPFDVFAFGGDLKGVDFHKLGALDREALGVVRKMAFERGKRSGGGAAEE